MLLLTYQPQMLTEEPGGSGKPLGFQTARERKNKMLLASWPAKTSSRRSVSPAVTPPAPMPAHKLIGAAAIGTPSPLAKGGSSDDWIGPRRPTSMRKAQRLRDLNRRAGGVRAGDNTNHPSDRNGAGGADQSAVLWVRKIKL